MAKNYTKVTSEEEQTIRNYLKSGMSFNKIRELTGRTNPTIRRIKKTMLNENESTADNVVELPTVEVDEAPEPTDTVRDHRDDPRFASNVSIQVVARIVGNKTGYSYRADFDKRVLEINNNEGIRFSIEFGMIEKFIDEMIDVGVEVGDLKKKFSA